MAPFLHARIEAMTTLVVALGNPGPKYEMTRHNVGVLALEELLSRTGRSLSVHKRTNTLVAEAPGVVFARTRDYMNLSGGPVKALMGYFGSSQLIVLHDELEADFGTVTVRTGGDRGHNGLRSISKALGHQNYTKVSLGIGRPPGRMSPAAFVLKPFSRAEQEELPIICADAADEVEKLLR